MQLYFGCSLSSPISQYRKVTIVSKPRETTARFTTKECKILLKAMNIAESEGLLVADSEIKDKITAKLKHRINAEEEANAIQTTSGGGATETEKEQAISC